MRLIGILLVILGAFALAFHGLSYVIPKETVDLGIFAITIYENHTISLTPLVGAICLIIGVVMIMVPRRRYEV